jgi:hypothetical protein
MTWVDLAVVLSVLSFLSMSSCYENKIWLALEEVVLNTASHSVRVFLRYSRYTLAHFFRLLIEASSEILIHSMLMVILDHGVWKAWLMDEPIVLLAWLRVQVRLENALERCLLSMRTNHLSLRLYIPCSHSRLSIHILSILVQLGHRTVSELGLNLCSFQSALGSLTRDSTRWMDGFVESNTLFH